MKVLSIAPGVVVGATLVAEVAAVALDVNTIVLAVIGLMGTSVTGYLALRMASLAQDTKESKDNLKEIHVAVNSSKTVLENKVDDLIKQNVELAKLVATMEENKRGAELAKAVASVPTMLVSSVGQASAAPASTPTAAPPVSGSPAAKLENAITDLRVAAKEAVVATEKTEGLAGNFPQK